MPILTYKPLGWTPLQCLDNLRKKNLDLQNTKLAYAGRLDPMAEGLLLILVGEECKERDAYQSLAKTYDFEVLFGFASDTYDILGLVQEQNEGEGENLEKKIRDTLPHLIGTFHQPYPPYSSARVNGKALFSWSRENRLDEITIPSKEVTVYSLRYDTTSWVTVNDLRDEIQKRVEMVNGDFRQGEILKQWDCVLRKTTIQSYPIASFSVDCSSGTYIRSLAQTIGQKIGIPALAWSIKRTKIGSFSIDNTHMHPVQ